MKIIAACCYYDKQLKKHIREGDAYEVTDERGKELVGSGLAKGVMTVPAQTAATATQTATETQAAANEEKPVKTEEKTTAISLSKKAKSGADTNK